MINKHHNRDYSGGFPTAVGDRYYAQDLFRDFDYLLDRAGLVGQDILQQQSKMIISGGVISAGATPATQIDISALVGYIKFERTIPDTFAALPPSTTTADIEFLRVAQALQNDITVNSGGNLNATLDGGSTNFVKVAYAEASGNSRTRAKKAGSYNYEQSPSVTLTIDTTAATDEEIVLGELVGDGVAALTLTTANRSFDLGKIKNLNVKAISQANYTIRDDEGFSVFEVETGSSDRTITLPTVADNKNREIVIKKSDAELGEVIIDGEGAETIEGDLTIELPTQYAMAKLYSNGTEWLVTGLYYRQYDTGWINRSDWTDVQPGSVNVDYDNLSGTFQLGEVVTESVSGNTGIITNDTGSTLILKEVTGGGTFTNNRLLTGADSGATADVDETATGDTKNKNSNVTHNLDSNQSQLAMYFYVSSDGTDANSILIGTVDSVGSSGSDFGHTARFSSVNELQIATTTAGLIFVNAVGNAEIINTDDWYYKIVVRKVA